MSFKPCIACYDEACVTTQACLHEGTGNVVANLNAARAEKAQDSRLWTSIDCLEGLLADLKSGKVKADQCIVHYFTNMPDGSYVHHYQVAGVTYPQHLALLAVAQRSVLDGWKGN